LGFVLFQPVPHGHDDVVDAALLDDGVHLGLAVAGQALVVDLKNLHGKQTIRYTLLQSHAKFLCSFFKARQHRLSNDKKVFSRCPNFQESIFTLCALHCINKILGKKTL
jgi:hypothetical protein